MAVGSVLAEPPAQAWWPAAGAGGRADARAQAAPWVVAGPGGWPPRRRPWRAGPPAQWGGRAAEGGPEGRAQGERLGLARTAPAPVPDATPGSRGPHRPAPGGAAPPGPCAPPGRGGSGGPAAREGAAREARAANPRRGRGPRARRPGHPAAWAPGGRRGGVWRGGRGPGGRRGGGRAWGSHPSGARGASPGGPERLVAARARGKNPVAPPARPTPARAAGPWPSARSGRGGSQASGAGVTGGRGPPRPHPPRGNGSWTGSGRVGALSSISDSNKLLLEA